MCEVVELDAAMRDRRDRAREIRPTAQSVLDVIAPADKPENPQADAAPGSRAVCHGEVPWLRQERAIRPKIAAWFAQETGT